MPVNFEKRPEPFRFTSPVAPLLQEIKQVLIAMFLAASAVAYALVVLVLFLPGCLVTWNSPANRREDIPTQYAPSQELPGAQTTSEAARQSAARAKRHTDSSTPIRASTSIPVAVP